MKTEMHPLMEWEMDALIFLLHSLEQNKNTDEHGDAEKQISFCSAATRVNVPAKI